MVSIGQKEDNRWRGDVLQVGKVDGGIGLLRVVVGQQAQVGKSPAEDVVDHQDGGVLVVAGNVCIQTGDLGLLARGGAIPLESGFAAFRHDGDMWGELVM